LIPAGRTLWIVDAHRDEKPLVVDVDEKLTAALRSSKIRNGRFTSS
jgi:hypothetical protein